MTVLNSLDHSTGATNRTSCTGPKERTNTRGCGTVFVDLWVFEQKPVWLNWMPLTGRGWSFFKQQLWGTLKIICWHRGLRNGEWWIIISFGALYIDWLPNQPLSDSFQAGCSVICFHKRCDGIHSLRCLVFRTDSSPLSVLLSMTD